MKEAGFSLQIYIQSVDDFGLCSYCTYKGFYGLRYYKEHGAGPTNKLCLLPCLLPDSKVTAVYPCENVKMFKVVICMLHIKKCVISKRLKDNHHLELSLTLVPDENCTA